MNGDQTTGTQTCCAFASGEVVVGSAATEIADLRAEIERLRRVIRTARAELAGDEVASAELTLKHSGVDI